MACCEGKFNFDKSPEIFNILLCCTGSVATIKLPIIVSKIRESLSVTPFEKVLPYKDIDVRVVTTEHSKHFFDPADLDTTVTYEDRDEWDCWKQRSDPVLHIELRKWADLMLIAPLCANTLAKLANGLCDNLLTCVARAWDFRRPIAFAPAMNTYMWEHPLTERQICTLKELGYMEIPCIEKTLVCGDTGKGAMAEVDTIVGFIREQICKGGNQG